MTELPVDHIAVVSRNMAADMEFYSHLGFTVESRYVDWAMMRDTRGFGVALLSPGGVHPPHCALRAPSRETVEQLARERGRDAVQHRDGSVSVYVTDASGNSVEVIFYPNKQ